RILCAAVAGWRFAYPAYGSVLLLPGGGGLYRPKNAPNPMPGNRTATPPNHQPTLMPGIEPPPRKNPKKPVFYKQN
ncbi:hypothetical protein, partial [Enterobacter hormaechei]